MKFTVNWQPDALARFADIWNNAADQHAVSAAANYIDKELERDPLAAGESRRPGVRILIESPLAVYFTVDDKRRQVTVWQVWRIC